MLPAGGLVGGLRRDDAVAAFERRKVLIGRITKVGKDSLRAMRVAVAWLLIREDGAMRQT